MQITITAFLKRLHFGPRNRGTKAIGQSLTQAVHLTACDKRVLGAVASSCIWSRPLLQGSGLLSVDKRDSEPGPAVCIGALKVRRSGYHCAAPGYQRRAVGTDAACGFVRCTRVSSLHGTRLTEILTSVTWLRRSRRTATR